MPVCQSKFYLFLLLLSFIHFTSSCTLLQTIPSLHFLSVGDKVLLRLRIYGGIDLKKEKVRAKGNIFRENLRLEIASALLPSFTFFFFGPLEIMLSNPWEFWFFSASDVAGLFFVSTLLCFLAAMGIQYLASLGGDRLLKICSSVLGGIGFCFYIQGNWTFTDYGKMNGTPIDWSYYSEWAVKNTVMWILILVIVILSINSKARYLSACTYIMLGVVGTEALTLGILFISSINTKPELNFTLEGGHEFHLSSNKNNIIVILADGFDGQNFLPVLEEEPSFRQAFDGFTFYEDTCGTSLYSEESGITLLTGNQLEVGPSFKDNINEAYRNTDLYDVLAQNHYDTYLYIRDKKMVSPVIGGQVANFSRKRETLNQVSAFQELYKMVSFRYMPHVMKKYFWYTYVEFVKIQGDKSSLFFNYDMYDLITKQGVIAEETEHNIYQFYWIQGPHDPANTDRYCHKLDQPVRWTEDTYIDSRFEQTIGIVRMYTELIAALKKAGIYDNTTIIFTADHGLDVRLNPCLLIKPANAHGELAISDVPVSMIEDYLPTLTYFITGEKDAGDTIYELKNGMKRTRICYEYSFNPDGQYKTYDERTEKIYEAGAFSKNIKLGTELSPDDIALHNRRGFEDSGHTSIRATGNDAALDFKIREEYSDLQLDLDYETYNGSQTVRIYANDTLVADFEANGNEEKSILIPGECVTDGNLRLRFSFPDAISPAELDPESRNIRKLALEFYSLKLSDAKNQ